jgi:hypothetical protein
MRLFCISAAAAAAILLQSGCDSKNAEDNKVIYQNLSAIEKTRDQARDILEKPAADKQAVRMMLFKARKEAVELRGTILPSDLEAKKLADLISDIDGYLEKCPPEPAAVASVPGDPQADPKGNKVLAALMAEWKPEDPDLKAAVPLPTEKGNGTDPAPNPTGDIKPVDIANTTTGLGTGTGTGTGQTGIAPPEAPKAQQIWSNPAELNKMGFPVEIYKMEIYEKEGSVAAWGQIGYNRDDANYVASITANFMDAKDRSITRGMTAYMDNAHTFKPDPKNIEDSPGDTLQMTGQNRPIDKDKPMHFVVVATSDKINAPSIKKVEVTVVLREGGSTWIVDGPRPPKAPAVPKK